MVKQDSNGYTQTDLSPASADSQSLAQIVQPPDRNPTPQRLLSYLLQQQGSRPISRKGAQTTQFAAIADMMIEALLTGRIPTEDPLDPEMEGRLLSSNDWLRLAGMVLNHVDGPPTREIRVAGDPDNPVQVNNAVQFYIPENGRRRARDPEQLMEDQDIADADFEVMED